MLPSVTGNFESSSLNGISSVSTYQNRLDGTILTASSSTGGQGVNSQATGFSAT